MAEIAEDPETTIVSQIKKGSSKVCRYFKKGFCGFAEKCLFRHSQSKGRSGLSSDVENCPFYKKASCKFASKCWYNHIRPNGKIYPMPDPLNKFIVVGPSGDEFEKNKDAVTPDENVAANPTCEIERRFRRPQNQDVIHKKCFYHEKKGTCYYGDKCWYSHSEQRVQPADESLHEPEEELDPDRSKMCYNFIFTECEYGNECLYVHGDVCQFCDLPFLHPYDESQRNDHLKACEIFFLQDMEISFHTMISKDKTCAICMDPVWGANKRFTEQKFGIQENCNHVFCLSCIRRWRDVKRKAEQKNQLTACPACRIESIVVVPCGRWFSNQEEKIKWVAEYKAAIELKPCKFYEKGNCKNEAKCPYLHAGFIAPPPTPPTPPPTETQIDDDTWQGVSNSELPSSEQENHSNQTDGREDITGDRNQEAYTQSDNQSNNDLVLQSGQKVDTINLPEEQQSHDNMRLISIGDGTDEHNVETPARQDMMDYTPPEQEVIFNPTDGWEGITRYRNQEENAQPDNQSNEDLVLQSGQQVGAINLAEEQQFDDSLGPISIGDGADEPNVETPSRQDVDVMDDWRERPPEDQPNKNLTLQYSEQVDARQLVEEMVEHQFDDGAEGCR